MNIALKYALFAALATSANLITQFILLRIISLPYELYFAIMGGTLVGLIVKFILDKNFIFYFKPAIKSENSRSFIAYTGTGIITTGIFWGIELIFNAIWLWEGAKYFGAAIGLSVGYFMKFHLDKAFVFAPRNGTRYESA
jgi:putative flippase GtrA